MTTPTLNQPPHAATNVEPRWRVVACFLLMLAAIQIALGPKIQLSQWGVAAKDDAGVAEGVAWLSGRLDIPHEGRDAARDRMHDTAFFNGKVYNVFPPLMGVLTVLLSPLNRALGVDVGFWLPGPYVLLVFWPLPILGFLAFRRQLNDSAWAALLTLAWIGGTSLLPNLAYARTGHLGPINHVICQTGLLLILLDLLGSQRIWPSFIGLLIATWTRQMTFLYAIPILWVAWQKKRLPVCLAGLILIISPLLVLNTLKFGSPFEFGYRYIYVNRETEELAQRCAQYGTFSPRFLLGGLYYMHLAPFRIDDISLNNVNITAANLNGTSIWLTSPILIAVLLSRRQWWADRSRRVLMLTSFLVMLGVCSYHSPGFLQSGYNRFALDFLIVWLVVAAPWVFQQHRRWFAVFCIAWSLLYFQAIVPNSPLPSASSAQRADRK